jgi:hypothetical protein
MNTELATKPVCEFRILSNSVYVSPRQNTHPTEHDSKNTTSQATAIAIAIAIAVAMIHCHTKSNNREEHLMLPTRYY